MGKVGFYFLFLLFSVIEVRADSEAVVVEVRKNTNLSKKDKVFKNFFINGGQDLGLKQGYHVDVLRRLPVHDPLKNASVGDLKVKVGTVEIIHSENKLSVARLVSYESMEQRPLLDYEAVMVGDRLDLTSVRVAPTVKEAVSAEPELEGEKVALLGTQSKAKKLIEKGERHLANLDAKKGDNRPLLKNKTRAPASVAKVKSKNITKREGDTALKKK